MAKTQITGNQIVFVARAEININKTGLALITRIIAGTNVQLSSTGVDTGTGDVTITASGSTPVASVFNRAGAVVKVAGDYTFFDLAGLVTAAQMPALTGDVTSVAGTLTTTLATVNSNVGTFNSFTVNAKGLITAASLTNSLVTTPLNANANTSYNDNSSYFGLATTTNGFPVNGTLTGARFGTVGTQRLHNSSGNTQYNRYWDSTGLAWRSWNQTIDNSDYSNKGILLVGTGAGTYSGFAPGADGLFLTASSASANGLAWALLGIAGGGTGAATASAALVNLGGAQLSNPTFTGIPTSPTRPAGDISSSILTTAFVQRTMNGSYVLTLPASGNITGTTSQLLFPVIILVGAITGPVNLIFPSTGAWSIVNNTTGGFTVTLKTSSGTGVTIAQGKTRSIIGDTINIQPASTDLTGTTNPPVGGTTRQMQWNNAGILSGTALLEASAQGNLVGIDNVVDPTTPTTGATYYSKKTGTRAAWYQQDTDGNVISYQTSMVSNRVSYWSHAGNSALLSAPSVTSFGFNMQTVGTPTARNVGTDFIGQNKRLYLLSAATAGSLAEIYNNSLQWVISYTDASSNKLGGFYCAIRCIITDPSPITAQTFIGLTSLSGPTPNATLATMGATTVMLGLACDFNQTQYLMINADASISGGNGFYAFDFTNNSVVVPCSGSAYNGSNTLDVRFYTPTYNNSLTYFYVKIDNTTTAPYSVVYQGMFPTKNINNSLLTPRIWRSNGSIASAVGIEVISMYIETLY